MGEIGSHDPKREFSTRPKIIPRSQVDYSRWTFRRDGEVFSAIGPCPQCNAEDQQKSTTVLATLPDESDESFGEDEGPAGRRHHAPDDEHPDIAFECKCGSSHGIEGARGCGALWVVTWEVP
jgi:hypothetical protein